MAKLEIDADKIKATGEEIKSIANDYNKVIVDLFNKMKAIEDSGIWLSESDAGAARKFIANVMKDQTSALALGTDMKNLGDKIISYANNVNAISDSKL